MYKNLLDMSNSEAYTFLDSFDTIVADINGVLWNVKEIPGVKDTMLRLQEMGKNIRFVSNNSSFTVESYKKQFKKIGIDFNSDDIMHPAVSLIDYLKSINFNQKLFCIASDITMATLTDAKIQCKTLEKHTAHSFQEVLEEISDDPEIGAVYVDGDAGTNYLKISKVITLLKRSDVKLFYGATDKFMPISSDNFILGPGYFQDIITEVSKRKPIILGKPSENLKPIIMNRFNIINPRRAIFVGDMIEQDMLFGSICNFQKMLVLSGVTSLSDLNNIKDPKLLPDYYITSLGDLTKVMDKAVDSVQIQQTQS